ncbi:MAG: hypothetical protein IBX53_02500 [Halomonas sp.]|uniref:hypothetical protein n=1 Tax=Halomonas sp. TaxID=1486246 RepID=UPI0019EBA0CD|nr:hypothetical protein [Halomonas sp.]MBE0487924.1 hypothetical protein [Halomonas sp.]
MLEASQRILTFRLLVLLAGSLPAVRLAWHWLHRLVCVSAALGVTHLWILTRADYRMPMLFAAALAALTVFRVADALLGGKRDA